MRKHTEDNLFSFEYKNYRGEIATRTVHVYCLEYRQTPGFGYEPGWFLSGFDVDRQAMRSFALENIIRSYGAIRFSIPDTWAK